MNNNIIISTLKNLGTHFKKKRKFQLSFLLALTFFTGIIEILSIASVLPFVKLVTDVNFFKQNSYFLKFFFIQNKTEAKHRRYTNLDLNLLAIDYEGEYAGFEIEAFNNINCMGILGSVLLLTHNSEHYDAFFDNETL